MSRTKKTYLTQPELNAEAIRLSTKYQAAVVEQYLHAGCGWKVKSVQSYRQLDGTTSYVVFLYSEGTFCGVLNDGSKHIDTHKINISAPLFELANRQYKKLIAA